MIFKNLFADEKKTYVEFQKIDPKEIQRIINKLKFEQLQEFSNPSPIFDSEITGVAVIPKKQSLILRNNFRDNKEKFQEKLNEFFNKFKQGEIK